MRGPGVGQELGGPPEVRGRALGVARLIEGAGEIELGLPGELDLVRPELAEKRLELLGGARELGRAKQSLGPPQVGGVVERIDLDRLAVVLGRLLPPALLRQGARQVVLGVAVGGVELDRLLEPLDGLVPPAGLDQCGAQVVLVHGVVRSDLDRLAVLAEGNVQEPLLERVVAPFRVDRGPLEKAAELIHTGVGEARVMAVGESQVLFRAGQIAGVAVRHAELVLDGVGRRLELERPLEERDRVPRLLPPHGDRAETLESRRRFRLELQGRPVALLGSVELAPRELYLAEADQGRHVGPQVARPGEARFGLLHAALAPVEEAQVVRPRGVSGGQPLGVGERRLGGVRQVVEQVQAPHPPVGGRQLGVGSVPRSDPFREILALDPELLLVLRLEVADRRRGHRLEARPRRGQRGGGLAGGNARSLRGLVAGHRPGRGEGEDEERDEGRGAKSPHGAGAPPPS